MTLLQTIEAWRGLEYPELRDAIAGLETPGRTALEQAVLGLLWGDEAECTRAKLDVLWVLRESQGELAPAALPRLWELVERRGEADALRCLALDTLERLVLLEDVEAPRFGRFLRELCLCPTRTPRTWERWVAVLQHIDEPWAPEVLKAAYLRDGDERCLEALAASAHGAAGRVLAELAREQESGSPPQRALFDWRSNDAMGAVLDGRQLSPEQVLALASTRRFALLWKGLDAGLFELEQLRGKTMLAETKSQRRFLRKIQSRLQESEA